jgi:hypothetical protein
VDEERVLAGSLAGVMFVTGGLTAVLLLSLPGIAGICMRGAKLTGKDRALSAVDWSPAA